MDSDAFLDRYPEFDVADNQELVQANLDEAAGRMLGASFGSRYDEAHGALAAHMLWASPFGLPLRGDSDSPESSKYLDHYNQVWAAIRAKSRVRTDEPRGW